MSDNLQSNDEHDRKLPDFNSIYSEWGKVFVKTYEIYCKSEPDGQRRHAVTLVALTFLGLLALIWAKAPEGLLYACLSLIAIVFVLSWKRT